MKRFLVKISVATVILSLLVLCGTAMAAFSSDYKWQYTVSGGGATIKSYLGSELNVTVPSSLGGYPVTAIGEMALVINDPLTNITSVTLPDTVKTIGSSAFSGMQKLQRVSLGEGLETIGYSAFMNCPMLNNVFLPDSLTSIGEQAFMSCGALSAVSFGSKLATIGDKAFSMCFGLTSLDLPDSLISIGSESFSLCTGLTTVRCGAGLKTVGASAFQGCIALEEIFLSAGITSIGTDAFKACYNVNLYVRSGSYAHQFALDNSLKYTIDDTIEPAATPRPTAAPVPALTTNQTVLSSGKYVKLPWDVIRTEQSTDMVEGWYSPSYGMMVVFEKLDYMPLEDWKEWLESYGYSADYDVSRNGVSFVQAIVSENSGEQYDIYSIFNSGGYSYSITASNFGDWLLLAQRDIPLTLAEDPSSTPAPSPTPTPTPTPTPEPVLSAGVNTISIPAGQTVKTAFTAPVDGMYKFYTTGSQDTYGYIYDENLNQQYYDDDSGDGNNFCISRVLNAGEKIYVGVRFYGSSAAGSVSLVVEQPQAPTPTPVPESELQVGTNGMYISAGQTVKQLFVAPETATYNFYTTGSSDTLGYLYDVNGNTLATDDDSGDSRNFWFTYDLTAGQQVYVGVKYYSSSLSGAAILVVEMENVTPSTTPTIAPTATPNPNEPGAVITSVERGDTEYDIIVNYSVNMPQSTRNQRSVSVYDSEGSMLFRNMTDIVRTGDYTEELDLSNQLANRDPQTYSLEIGMCSNGSFFNYTPLSDLYYFDIVNVPAKASGSITDVRFGDTKGELIIDFEITLPEGYEPVSFGYQIYKPDGSILMFGYSGILNGEEIASGRFSKTLDISSLTENYPNGNYSILITCLDDLRSYGIGEPFEFYMENTSVEQQWCLGEIEQIRMGCTEGKMLVNYSLELPPSEVSSIGYQLKDGSRVVVETVASGLEQSASGSYAAALSIPDTLLENPGTNYTLQLICKRSGDSKAHSVGRGYSVSLNGLQAGATAHTGWQETQAQPATCTQPGNEAYSGCTDCGSLFNVFGEEIEEGSWVIPATGIHTVEGSVCKHCRMDLDISAMDVLVLPESAAVIGAEAFEGAAAEAIILPAGCTEIGARAFAGCSDLQYVFMPDHAIDIAPDAFEGCSGLVFAYMPQDA